MLCDYGCGQEATHQFKNGKWCCGVSTNSCPVVKAKKPTNKGKTFEEIYGEEKAREMKGSIGDTLREYYKTHDNPFLGKTHTEETLKKFRDFRHTEETKEFLRQHNLDNPRRYWLNKKRSEEDRKKFSDSHKGKPSGMKGKTGELHPAYIDGRSYEPYPPEFTNKAYREEIRERDGYTCQLCCKTQQEEMDAFGKKLSIHHIDYDKKNNAISNHITLCCSCNSRANKNREFWENYFGLANSVREMIDKEEVTW